MKLNRNRSKMPKFFETKFGTEYKQSFKDGPAGP